MFTLTAQDLHGVIVEKPAEASEIEDAICKESGLLNPDGCGKTLRVGGGGGSLTKKHNYQHVLIPQSKTE